MLQAQQDDRNVITGGNIYLNVGNVALTDAHLWWEYISHWEFSNENLNCAALIREVAFANPFSVKIINIIISKLLELSIFYANRLLLDFQWLVVSQLIVLY